jgi:hypothetical protein
VTCIARQKDAMVFMEMICETLTNAVCGPPKDTRKLHCIWIEDFAGSILQVFESYLLRMRTGGKLDVEANKLASFTRDDEKVALSAVDCAFATDVWESGLWVDVHYSPNGVCGVAEHSIA